MRLRCVGIGGAFNAETGGEGQLVAQCRELVVSDQTTIERAHVLDAQLAGPAKIDPARPPPIDVDPLEIRSGKADIFGIKIVSIDIVQRAVDELDTPQLDAAEIDHSQHAALEGHVEQMRAAEVSANELAIYETGIAQRNESCPAQVAANHRAVRHTEAGHSPAHECDAIDGRVLDVEVFAAVEFEDARPHGGVTKVPSGVARILQSPRPHVARLRIRKPWR